MEIGRFHHLLAALLLLLVTSCGKSDRARATESAILDQLVSPFDLLISASDMPPGWESTSPYTFADHMCYRCAAIDFYAHSESQSKSMQEVFAFPTTNEAARMFSSEVEPRVSGYLPEGWDFNSEFADRSLVACVGYEGSDFPACTWSGLYGDYIVQFFTWIIPGKMTVQQFEEVVVSIDQKMLLVTR